MSWLARSLANSLQIEDQEQDDHLPTTSNDDDDDDDQHQSGSNSETLTDGVKGDLTEFTESLARQIWGVASFLAPPPPPPPLRHRPSTTTTTTKPDRDSICEDSRFGGEIGATTFINDDDDDDDENKGFVGVTDEVLQFAMNIAHHPETWLDFPLSEEEDSDDFEMSDTQWNHATLVEHLVPRLAALRIEFCPVHMSESYFWKVYFVLLHPRLNKHDADLLSTPQIVAARSMWMKELQIQTKPGPDSFIGNTNTSQGQMLENHEDYNTTSSDSPCANMSEKTTHAFEPTTYHTVTEKQQPVLTKEEKSTSESRIEDFDEDEDNWIHENSELDGYDGPDVPIGDDEDISFSDLEDDDCTMPVRSNNII